jgi:hypothetical protein
MIRVKTLRVLWTFYNSFIISTLVLTGSCMYMVYELGAEALMLITWFKIITSGVIVYYINNYKNKEFYYYQNLGLSKRTLWLSTMTADFALYILVIILTLEFRGA